MSASASLIPELEDVIQHGSQEKRADDGPAHRQSVRRWRAAVQRRPYRSVRRRAVPAVVEIETKARAEMAQTLAPIANAPAELMRQLAHDDDIAVAGPVLTQSARLAETELVEFAETKGQAHLRRHRRPRGHRRGRHRRAGPARRHRGDAQRRRQPVRQAVRGWLLGAGQARGRRRRTGREGR